MNKSFFISIVIFLLAFNCNAQENLVPNPSFEVTDSCGEFYYFSQNGLGGWFAPTPGTSDMFNECTTDEPNVDVPNNYLGWQYARTGTGYAGLITYETVTYNPDIFDQKEYLEIKLKSLLLAGRKYKAHFYVSEAEYYATCSSNMLGMYLSKDSIYSDIPWGLLDYPPQIESNSVIFDTINWVKIEGEFIANGGEEYLTIGCFRHDDELTVVCDPEDVLQRFVYYFIDDVSITLIPLEYNVTIPNIFTPNGDEYNNTFRINTKGYINASISIFNRWGNVVFEAQDVNFEWDGNHSSEGVYYYILELAKEDQTIDIKKGTVQLIR